MDPKRQHTIPRFYLEFFSDPEFDASEPQIWLIRRGCIEPIRTNVRNAAVRHYYYSFKDSDGKRSDAVENVLGQLEGAISPLIVRICAKDPRLSFEDRANIALFVSTTLLRVPAARRKSERIAGDFAMLDLKRRARTPGEFERLLTEVEKSKGRAPDCTPSQLRRAVLENRIRAEGTPEWSLQIMLQLAPQLALGIASMKWTVLESENGSRFLTSDNPVVFLDPTRGGRIWECGLSSPGVELTIPLSPQHCLFMVQDFDFVVQLGKMSRAQAREALRRHNPEVKYRTVGGDLVAEINRRVIDGASESIFSSTINLDVRNLLGERFHRP